MLDELDRQEMERMFKVPDLLLVFALVFLDGKQRNDLLGLEDAHYRSKRKADKWRDDLAAKLRAVEMHVPTTTYVAAIRKLDRIHENVTCDTPL